MYGHSIRPQSVIDDFDHTGLRADLRIPTAILTRLQVARSDKPVVPHTERGPQRTPTRVASAIMWTERQKRRGGAHI